MSVLQQLASARGVRGDGPNKALAERLARSGDREAVALLASHLGGRDRRIASDCIKVLYELGEKRPDLLAPHRDLFLSLLQSRNNRMIWGAMHALACIAQVDPASLVPSCATIAAAMDAGSVITRDHGMRVLAACAALPSHRRTVVPLILERLATAPDNQFPSYVERTAAVMTGKDRSAFLAIVEERVRAITSTARRSRIAKALRWTEPTANA